MPPRLGQPFDAIRELEVTELVGQNEQVDQNDYGASVGIDLPGALPVSGELLNFLLISRSDSTIQTPAGSLFIFDDDPEIASGATSMVAASRRMVIAEIPVAAADWQADANGGSVCVHNKPTAFHGVTALYFAWFHEDATSLNDGAGDNDILQFNAWYRRDS